MRGSDFIVVAALLGGLMAHHGRARADGPPPFVVIVNVKNGAAALQRDFVSEAFLKKTTRWPNGDVIKPVDLSAGSATRERFSKDVHRRSVTAVKSYWQQRIFSGRDVPPPEVANDEEVVKYVVSHEGAIGYVGGGANLARDVRAVVVRE